MTFRALLATQPEDKIETTLIDMSDADLMDGNVTVRIEWSTVNYKDGLALHAGLGIIQRTPLVPGIDFAGTVITSDDPRFAPGDKVVANSWGLSQTHHGGYAERARVPGDWLVKLPDPISPRTAMAIGTAGYTSMLCVLALEHGGITPARGPVLVTGAGGGVGSVAIALLSNLGYHVVASTGRLEEEPYLRSLGASEIIDRSGLSGDLPPMGAERWAACIDSVGSKTLANVLSHISYRGVVAACGLAQGIDLPGSMLPFITRNVTLAGIDSVNAPQSARVEAWDRLATDLDQRKLDSTVQAIGLAEVVETAGAILQGKVRGRTIVDLTR